MHNRFIRVGLLIVFLFSKLFLYSQSEWPRKVELGKESSVTIYQPQPEKLEGNILSGRAAISIKRKSGDEPVFGVISFTSSIETNRDNRMVLFNSLSITSVRMADSGDNGELAKLKSALETDFLKWKIKVTIDDITATIQQEQKNGVLKNDPPKILFTTKPSILVTIDSMPVLKTDDKLKMKKVINTAFLIVQNPGDQKYYLYGGKYWYQSSKITEGWKYIKTLPKEIQALDQQIKKSEPAGSKTDSTGKAEQPPASVLISTVPAELIQTKGDPNFSTIAGADLLYVSNSEDDIFKNLTDNQYYILLSGRWYSSLSLQGPWAFVDPAKLPSGFSKIPEGSAKDDVLASVPGTDAAKNAAMDAEIPQTAKVEKATASCKVKYDGTPVFEQIEGTHLFRASNTASTVIRDGNIYYCVDAGVWFKSTAPTGPWVVSESRPEEVKNIPPSSVTYNVKYVQIYQVTPSYVYVGYTPGYTGCYVIGGVVVYGTGYVYYPWYAGYYYPRPVTYGFSVRYNPWTGWSFGFHYSTGYFSFHFYTGGHYGYWGPRVYRPVPYPVYHGGMYGRNSIHIHGDVHIHQGNNMYFNRNGVRTNDIQRNNNRPTTYDVKNKAGQGNPNTMNNSFKRDNVLSDPQGNVYRQDDKNQWQQRDRGKWSPADKSKEAMLNKELNNRERANTMDNDYRNSSRNREAPSGRKSSSGRHK